MIIHRGSKAFSRAFMTTIPIMLSFLFLGASYGIYMRSLGFEPWLGILTSIIVFAGGMEFATASLLCMGFDPIGAFFMTLTVNSRHIFYGSAMLEKYSFAKREYLIFSLCNETFSINSSAKIPGGIEPASFYFWVSLLNQCYWVAGVSLGSFLGSSSMNIKGLDFITVALFVVLFMDSFMKEKDHRCSVIGLVVSALCLVAFGSGSFVLISLALMTGLILILRKRLGGSYESD